MGLADEHTLPCRTCRSVTEHTLARPATTVRGMTTEVWTCVTCGTLESRSYRAVSPDGATRLEASSPQADSIS